MTVAVVQPLPGIGDMIWHLPHIRAIAAHVGAPVTLITKPRSAADQIFSAERTIRDVFWLDRNPEARRGEHDGGAGFIRVVGGLARTPFRCGVCAPSQPDDRAFNVVGGHSRAVTATAMAFRRGF